MENVRRLRPKQITALGAGDCFEKKKNRAIIKIFRNDDTRISENLFFSDRVKVSRFYTEN